MTLVKYNRMLKINQGKKLFPNFVIVVKSRRFIGLEVYALLIKCYKNLSIGRRG
jgi:hypothetical protein